MRIESVSSVVDQSIQEIASDVLETRRVPDPWHNLIINNELCTLSGIPVKKFIRRDNPLQEAEYQGFEKIEAWAVKNTHGACIWISPPAWETYSDCKIVFMNKTTLNGQNALLNRAVVLGINTEQILDIFHSLTGWQEIVSDINQLRSSPLVFEYTNNEKEIELIKIITKYDQGQRDMIFEGMDIIAKHDILQHLQSIGLVNRQALVFEVNRQGLFGHHPNSCEFQTPGGAFNTYLQLATAENSFPCPKCEKPIPSGRGITKCPHCGLTKEEAGSTCD